MEDYRVSLVGGGKPLAHGSLLARDGRHFIVPFNNQLRVFFITTRQCIRSLKFNAENKINLSGLIDLKQDLENQNLVWAFLRSGEVLVINWKEKVPDVVVKRSQIPLNKDDCVLRVGKFTKDEVVVITGKNSAKPHTRNIIQYHIANGETTTLASIKNVLLFSISMDTSKYAFLSKNDATKDLHTVDLNNLEKKQTHPFQYKAFVTALAISNDSIIAIGTSSGGIHIILENLTRLLKWHIDQVKSLCFSQDGKYLMSGGSEKVLVFWQLDTEKQQFLPRLNGEIVEIECQNEEFLNLALKLDNQGNHEILVLSSVDLQSRLLISGPRQGYNSDLNNIKKLCKAYQKNPSQDAMKLKYDFTTQFKIHPTTKQLYFINGSNLQVFDFFKNEQASLQKITDTLQTGKVRSEHKLLDPMVKDFQFTRDGKWLATVEEHQHGQVDNLLSKDDHTYVLKLWRSIETQSKQSNSHQVQSSWELVTKIVNPHGVHVPIHALISAPTSYFNGIAFLTADNNGGVRLWRPITNNVDEIVSWSLRKMKTATGVFSNCVSLAWSDDASLIFLGFDDRIVVIDASTFEEIDTSETQVLANITGSAIKNLEILDNQLCVLSKTSLKSVNLLTMQENDLVLRVASPKNGENIICFNQDKSLICIAVNYFNNHFKKIQAKVFVFNPYSKIPVFQAHHDEYVCGIQWNFDTDFIFIDILSRIGLVTATRLAEEEDEQLDYAREMAVLLQRAQGEGEIYKQVHSISNEEEINGRQQLDINSFAGLFESVDVQLSTMFERVMQVIS
jgi:NET1-associated nuclear protein 1 (U3 small nucleolar RNA-associated protein 17)